MRDPEINDFLIKEGNKNFKKHISRIKYNKVTNRYHIYNKKNKELADAKSLFLALSFISVLE